MSSTPAGEVAVATSKPSRFSRSLSAERMSAWSSATSMRGCIDGSCMGVTRSATPPSPGSCRKSKDSERFRPSQGFSSGLPRSLEPIVPTQLSNSGETAMSSKDRHLQTRGGAARRDKTRSGMVAALASLLVGTGGCGSSSNGGPDDSVTGGNPPPPPPVTELLVTIKVQDAFGAPVPGAEIKLLRSEGTGVSPSAYFADQDGQAQILTDSLTHGALVKAPDMEGAVYESTGRPTTALRLP